MPRPLAAWIGLLVWSSSVAAQNRIGFRTGMLATTDLVRDSIVNAFGVRPDIGPTIGFDISTTLNAYYRLAAGLNTSWGRLRRHGATGMTADVVPLSTWTPAVSLFRNLVHGLSAYATAGAIIYQADRNAANLFRGGSPPMPLLGAGVKADRSVGRGLLLTVSLDYDVHRFHTPALTDAGFRGERPVHRVGLSVGVARGL